SPVGSHPERAHCNAGRRSRAGARRAVGSEPRGLQPRPGTPGELTMRNFLQTGILILLTLPLLASGPCEDSTHVTAPAPPDTPAVPLPAELRLAPDEGATVGPEATAVRFVAVREDSRCPSSVVCVWAGQAIVELAVGDGAAPLRLTVGETGAEAAGLSWHATALDPYPQDENPIPVEDYR